MTVNKLPVFQVGDYIRVEFDSDLVVYDKVVRSTEHSLETECHRIFSSRLYEDANIRISLVVPRSNDNTNDEIRVTSSTGGQKGSKKARFDLIPEDSLWQLAESYGINLEKYPKAEDGLENWRHGYPWSLSYAAMERHLRQSLAGEKIDPENGVNHLISVAWHALALVHYMGRDDLQHFDDRQSTVLKKYLEKESN